MADQFKEEEVIDMVEEPGSNTWSSSKIPGTNIASENIPLFGGMMGDKKKWPLILGALLLALLLCCICSFRGCANNLGNLGTTTSTTNQNDTGILGNLLNNDTTTQSSTEYSARIGQEFTLGGITFLLQQGTEDDYNGRSVEAYQATITNNSNQSITIRNDAGWSALDSNGNYLEYDWYSDAHGASNTDVGTIEPGDTYYFTMVFLDGNGNPTTARDIMAQLSRSLGGYDTIVWSN